MVYSTQSKLCWLLQEENERLDLLNFSVSQARPCDHVTDAAGDYTLHCQLLHLSLWYTTPFATLSAITDFAQCVTLSWEWGGKKEEMELWDIQFDGKGRLDWAAVKETFSADVVRILGKGTPPLLKKGEWEGYTRETFQPGSTIQLSVDRRGQGMAAHVLLLAGLG